MGEKIESSPYTQQRKRLGGDGSASNTSGSSSRKQMEKKGSENPLERNVSRSGSNMSTNTGSMRKQKDKRISNASSQVSGSSDRPKKRRSSVKRISYDGMVFDLSESVDS